jgi:membrane-bound lytic murein transglycosylase D
MTESCTPSDINPSRYSTSSSASPSLTVVYRDSRGLDQTKLFSSTFIIGRDHACDIQLEDDCISRQHVKVLLDGGVWIVSDLGSTNGSYLDDQRINSHRLMGRSRLQLGSHGPTLVLEIQSQSSDQLNNIVAGTNDANRYIDPDYEGPMGDFTYMVRDAISKSSKKQSRAYVYIIGLVGLILVGVMVYAIIQQYRLEQLDALAVDIFYNMKEVELQVANLEAGNESSGGAKKRGQMSDLRAMLALMKVNYDAYLIKGGLINTNMSEEDRIILRIARIFGECELNLPKEFVDEVKRYIKKWQSSNRLTEAIKRARLNGYTQIVRDVMLEHYLPPQFFYLALQESDYKRNSIGPKTRFGIAKGIWQFIPVTATHYGLRTGPLLEKASYDPKDERFDFEKATQAAAGYIREIYTTDAQASGLLVMASYNWGEYHVIERIRDMPNNPRDRNFWQLLKKHQLPRETYDYVYYIFSAAVIGENPRLFGFDFDNPLAPSVEKTSTVASDQNSLH